MAPALSWTDRLHIERAVWTVDVLISALPAKTQRAILRELRANLNSAAAEVGAAEAVRRLGGLRRLARGYLDVEFGDNGPRPSWLRGLFWALAAELLPVMLAFLTLQAFMDGVIAADAHASGTYTWHALAPVFPSEEVTYEHGDLRSFGFTIAGPMVGLPAVAFLLGARAWRWLRLWRRRQGD